MAQEKSNHGLRQAMGRQMPDKVLLANVTALKWKYGPDGFRKIRIAADVLIAADLAAGLVTRLVDISNPAQMRRYRATAVRASHDEKQNKDAVDSVYLALRPHYIVLLDGPDVIPHILLSNPTPEDGDANVPSDLPYASDHRLTGRHVAAYSVVTRVVGRMPGIVGAEDPKFLISQLRNAANFRSRRHQDYAPNFAMAADVWRRSTEQSATNIFGQEPIKTSPPTSSPRVERLLKPLSHFINCHGADTSPQFYGQRGKHFPIAMTSDDVARGVRRHTIVAAECCYGAQLFDPKAASGKWPISNAYLSAGAVAFFGSTTIAYGPNEGNSSADLITQYFMINVLATASLGRACLQARQRFVQTQRMENPVNLKTLGQFILLGDPSLQPVRDDSPDAELSSDYIDYREARERRRVALVAAGHSAVSASGFPKRRLIVRKSKLHKLVHEAARKRGFVASLDHIKGYEVEGGDHYAAAMRSRKARQKVFIVIHREASSRNRTPGVPLIRILVAHAQNDSLIGLHEYVRK